MIQALRRSGPLAAWAAFLIVCLVAAQAMAAPSFPKLTGRVVDAANMLSPQAEASLDAKLAGLEARNRRQLVVATVPSLQGYEIEDYGYQLGRAWGIGQKGENDGALLIVAPNEKKVRIEVGYGLEGILTDALSSVIIQRTVLPRFRQGDMEGGVTAGADALIQQLSLDDAEAQARAKAAIAQVKKSRGGPGIGTIIFLVIMFMVFSGVFGGGRRRRGGGWAPIIFTGGGGGGGWSSGGGGFSGGGGSFGGGGASGGW